MNKGRARSSGSFFPKKSLGQNFLVNPRIQQKIIEACELEKDDVVLEIGPGQGALTRPLSERVSKVFAIEKDDRLAGRLSGEFAGTNVLIIHDDVLEYSFDRLPEGVKVVGNLPYNIATPIIEKVLTFRHKFSAFYLTVQLEYGNRIAATPGSRDYGSLSCFVQYYADVRKLFNIPPSAFSPAPKVESCFLFLRPLSQPRWPARDEQFLFILIRACFSQRRKTIRNSLATVYGEETGEILKKLNIDPMLRAEDLGLQDYVRLANRGL